MSDYDFVVKKIGRRSLEQLDTLATRSGVPYSTVLKIARGYTTNPKAQTLEPLVRTLRLERGKKKRRA